MFCVYRFGSWTYSSYLLDIVEYADEGDESSLMLSGYSEACPSVVKSHTARRNSEYYEDHDEAYIDITMTLLLAGR